MTAPFTNTYRDIVKRLMGLIDTQQADYTADLLEIPTGFYTSPEQYDREVERIFRTVPLLTCLSSDVGAIGSWRTFDIVGTPILIVRGTDGELRAFLNSCRHRGVRVADGQGQNARRFTCPFHAWSYDLNGALVGVPHESAFEGMCRNDRSLVPVPVAEKYGLVFVRSAPGKPIDLDAYLGDLGPELAEFDFGGFHCARETHVHEMAANWKFVMDTFNEIYHFSYLHRKTGANLMYGDRSTIDPIGPHIRHVFAMKSLDTLREIPEQDWTPIFHAPYHYIFFPNISLTVVSAPENDFQPATYKLELNQTFPAGTDKSVVYHTAYSVADIVDEQARQRELEMMEYTCTAVLDNEDFWAAAQEQLTVNAGANSSLLFGRNEKGCQLFNRSIMEYSGVTLEQLR